MGDERGYSSGTPDRDETREIAREEVERFARLLESEVRARLLLFDGVVERTALSLAIDAYVNGGDA